MNELQEKLQKLKEKKPKKWLLKNDFDLKLYIYSKFL